MAPPAGLSGPAGGEAGARGANANKNSNNANANAAAANNNAPPPPPPEEPLADGGILPREAALVKGLLRSMVWERDGERWSDREKMKQREKREKR